MVFVLDSMTDTFIRNYTTRGLPLPEEILKKLEILKGDEILIELKDNSIICKKINKEDLKKLT